MTYPTNVEVKSLWLANTDGAARNDNHSLHCDHGMLYSYRTMIARWDNHPRDGNGPVCLITSRRYSKTTTAHMPKGRDVLKLNPEARVLLVDDVGLTPDHERNMETMLPAERRLYAMLYLPEGDALKQAEQVAQEERSL